MVGFRTASFFMLGNVPGAFRRFINQAHGYYGKSVTVLRIRCHNGSGIIFPGSESNRSPRSEGREC